MNRPTWSDIGSLIVAVAALLIAIISLRQSDESNSVAREALKITSEERIASHRPALEATYFVARSPDLLNDEDIVWITARQLIARPIATLYWRTERAKYIEDSKLWYLFVAVANRGPGTAQEINISDLEWIPKNGSEEPIGLNDIEAPLGVLQPGQFYALLVDVVSDYDLARPLYAQQYTHFSDISVTVGYKDTLGNSYQLPIRVSQGISPPPPTQEP